MSAQQQVAICAVLGTEGVKVCRGIQIVGHSTAWRGNGRAGSGAGAAAWSSEGDVRGPIVSQCYLMPCTAASRLSLPIRLPLQQAIVRQMPGAVQASPNSTNTHRPTRREEASRACCCANPAATACEAGKTKG